MIKKIIQNKTRIEANISCINLTPNLNNALTLEIVYISNDVTVPFNSMTSQSQNEETYCEREWSGARFEIYRSAVEHYFISSCTKG